MGGIIAIISVSAEFARLLASAGWRFLMLINLFALWDFAIY